MRADLLLLSNLVNEAQAETGYRSAVAGMMTLTVFVFRDDSLCTSEERRGTAIPVDSVGETTEVTRR